VRTRVRVVVVLLTLAAAVGRAQTVDIDSRGPRVGAAMPEFTLRDQRGEARSLKSLLGPKGAIIVFFRSADW
jgi:cytochrome oxidase Cu insertion factor (SCO1/SenC/PrrC family)